LEPHNAEPDLAGYNLYRDGKKLNTALPVTSAEPSASSYDYNNYSPASAAFDDNPATYWASQYGYGKFHGAWWEIDLTAPLLVDHLEISGEPRAMARAIEQLYAGKDFEIQTWSGHGVDPTSRRNRQHRKDYAFDFSRLTRPTGSESPSRHHGYSRFKTGEDSEVKVVGKPL